MTNKRVFEVWSEVLRDTLGCVEDGVGNRPCDWGCPCEACSSKWVDDIFRKRLAEEEMSK